MEQLILEIMRRLEIDGQYVRHVDHWDTSLITEIRSAGRKAGRRLGHKVRTFGSGQLCADHGSHTVVAVIDMERDKGLDEETRDLRRENAAESMRRRMDQFFTEMP